jgi:perosamine synthetase
MVSTNDAELAAKVDMLRNHGASISEEQRHAGPRPYLLPEFNLLGFNYRMTDLQGAVGLVQLGKLDRFIDERQRWAEYYRRELADVPWLATPSVPEGYRHGWQAYVCRVDEARAPMPRNDIMDQLQALMPCTCWGCTANGSVVPLTTSPWRATATATRWRSHCTTG